MLRPRNESHTCCRRTRSECRIQLGFALVSEVRPLPANPLRNKAVGREVGGEGRLRLHSLGVALVAGQPAASVRLGTVKDPMRWGSASSFRKLIEGSRKLG